MTSLTNQRSYAKNMRIPALKQTELVNVPSCSLEALGDFIKENAPVLVLTGAGLSTGSGIPAYRDTSGKWMRRTPIFFQDFIECAISRRRYWARSYFGWENIASSLPNQGHIGLSTIEKKGFLQQIITQNVDGLHQKAGSHSVIELHGQLGRVKCLDCGARFARDEIQNRLRELNKGWSADILGNNPDGDVDLDEAAYPDFQVAHCENCDGRLKPDVVFFGESVPANTLNEIHKAITKSQSLLVIGSSLVVMSGYRLIKQAHELGKPICAINQGTTRADHLLTAKLNQACVVAIEKLVDAL